MGPLILGFFILVDITFRPKGGFVHPTRTTAPGRKVKRQSKRREKMSLIYAIAFYLKHPRAAHASCSDQ